MKPGIETDYVNPPIPYRSHDWRAVFEWDVGDEDDLVGWGETEESAVLDLLTQAVDHDEDSYREAVVDLAFRCWQDD